MLDQEFALVVAEALYNIAGTHVIPHCPQADLTGFSPKMSTLLSTPGRRRPIVESPLFEEEPMQRLIFTVVMVGVVLMCSAIIVEEFFVPDVLPVGGH